MASAAEKKQEKRGLLDLGYGSYNGHGSYGQFSSGYGHSSQEPNIITKTIEVPIPQPYPVTVDRHVPFHVKVPVDRPYKVEVPKPYTVVVERPVPVHVDRPVPYEVRVPIKVPVIQRVEIPVPRPYPVHVDKPYTVHVPKPIYVEKQVPVYINNHAAPAHGLSYSQYHKPAGLTSSVTFHGNNHHGHY